MKPNRVTTLSARSVLKAMALAVVLGASAISCAPREDTDCNCGTVVSDEVRTSRYYLNMRNNCTGRTKEIEVAYDVWQGKAAGDKVCFANLGSW